MEAKTRHYKLTRPFARLTKKDATFLNGETATWWVGSVETFDGIVGVYRQSGSDAHTALSFVAEAIHYERTFQKCLSDRFLVTAAARFAREITDAE